MNCPECKAPNDDDALFCTACGKPFDDIQLKPVAKQRRAYFIALLFIPVVIIAVAIGYYKFYLPAGVAAVVNGEEIKQSELDAAVTRMKGGSDVPAGNLRYQALDELIYERLVLQEARKAGITVSKDALASAVAEAQAASGLDQTAFNKAMCEQYGTMHGFENEIEHRIMINRMISERVAPPGADAKTAARAVNQWLEDLSARATVRIALAEELAGPGCGGCCNKPGERVQDGRGANTPDEQMKPAPLLPGEPILLPH